MKCLRFVRIIFLPAKLTYINLYGIKKTFLEYDFWYNVSFFMDNVRFLKTRKVEGEENPRYYYGIMQIVMFEGDDSKCFVEKDGKKFIDTEKAYDLFMKPVYLDIKTQCEFTK